MNEQVLERAISFIDSWLQFRQARLEMPGFVVAICHDRKIVFNQAYGHADIEHGQRMTSDRLFRVASHSKTFTATAILQLAERELLNLDDPVVGYVPWLAEHGDPRMQHVTVRQVMSHSAGLIRDGLDANFWELTNPFPDFAKFKQALLEADLIFDTNKQMKYSNFGYTLLGCLIEEVSGSPFNTYVQDNILQPLKLADTGPEFEEGVLERLVTGYTRRDGRRQRLPISRRINTETMSAATGFYSTAADLCTYFQAHFVGSGKLLGDQSKKEMQRTQWRLNNSSDNQEYGLGFAVDYAGDRRLIGHGGGFPGQLTRTFCDPAEKLVVVVLTNCADGEPRAIGKGIFSIIDHFESSAAQAGDPESQDQLRRFQGIFMNLWGDLAIVESGRFLSAVDPNTWLPFGKDQQMQKLELIDKCTLKIVRANGYDNEGEMVSYQFGEGGVATSIRYAGSEMLPESKYQMKLAGLKTLGLLT